MVTDHNLRPVDIAHTRFPRIKSRHGTLQMPPPLTLAHHMHALLEASQGLRACACVRVGTSQMHSCLPGCYRLFSVPGAPLATSDGFGPPSFPLSPCQLALVSGVSTFTADITEKWKEDAHPRGGRWKQPTTFQASCSSFVLSCQI